VKWLVGLAIVSALVGFWGRTVEEPRAVFAIEQGNRKSYRHSRDSIDVRYRIRVKNIGEAPGRVDCWAYLDGERFNGSHVSQLVAPGATTMVGGLFSLPPNTPNHVLDDIEPGCNEGSG
jgi:hypothetical protein